MPATGGERNPRESGRRQRESQCREGRSRAGIGRLKVPGLPVPRETDRLRAERIAVTERTTVIIEDAREALIRTGREDRRTAATARDVHTRTAREAAARMDREDRRAATTARDVRIRTARGAAARTGREDLRTAATVRDVHTRTAREAAVRMDREDRRAATTARDVRIRTARGAAARTDREDLRGGVETLAAVHLDVKNKTVYSPQRSPSRPRKARESGTIRKTIKRKSMRRTAVGQTRAAEGQTPVFQRLCRSQLLSRNKRRRSRRSRRLRFQRSLPSGNWQRR